MPVGSTSKNASWALRSEASVRQPAERLKASNAVSAPARSCKSRVVLFEIWAARLGLGVRVAAVYHPSGNAMTAFPLRRLPCSNDASSAGACAKETV